MQLTVTLQLEYAESYLAWGGLLRAKRHASAQNDMARSVRLGGCEQHARGKKISLFVVGF